MHCKPLRLLRAAVIALDGVISIAAYRFYIIPKGGKNESLDMAQKAINRFIIDRNPSVFGILNDVIIHMEEDGAKEALNLVLDISKKVNVPVTFSDQFSYHLAYSN